MANNFLRAEAAAVTCTLGPIPDALATEFARIFYRNLQSRRAGAAEAILAARQALRGEPLANVFTLVGDGDFVLRS